MKHYLLLFLIITVFIASACSKNGLVFAFSKDELQNELQKFFPITPIAQDKEKSKVDLTLSNPVLNLQEGNNKIAIQVNIEVELSQELSALAKPEEVVANAEKELPNTSFKFSQKESNSKDSSKEKLPLPTKFTGSATISASISYDQKAKGIHLSNSNLSGLNIEKLPQVLVKEVTQLAEKTLSQKFLEKPIPLKGQSELEKIAISSLKSVSVKDGKLLIEIGW